MTNDVRSHLVGLLLGAEEDWPRAFEAILKAEVRGGILEQGIRPDSRKPDEIRPIWSRVGYLPRVHGSAIFTRGQTQALTTVTLGSMDEGAGSGDRARAVTPRREP